MPPVTAKSTSLSGSMPGSSARTTSVSPCWYSSTRIMSSTNGACTGIERIHRPDQRIEGRRSLGPRFRVPVLPHEGDRAWMEGEAPAGDLDGMQPDEHPIAQRGPRGEVELFDVMNVSRAGDHLGGSDEHDAPPHLERRLDRINFEGQHPAFADSVELVTLTGAEDNGLPIEDEVHRQDHGVAVDRYPSDPTNARGRQQCEAGIPVEALDGALPIIRASRLVIVTVSRGPDQAKCRWPSTVRTPGRRWVTNDPAGDLPALNRSG